MTETKDLSFQEFTQLALRTESKVTSANLNVQAFMDLLELFITVGTLLDYTKKGIFYNNYTKYDENYEALVNKLMAKVADFHSSSEKYSRVNHDSLNFRLIHGLLGAVTESSEIAEHLLKYITTGEIDKVGIGEEFSDIDWYKAITFDELQLEENTCRTNVINKLKVRFPDKYDDAAAANRNLEEERKKLEENL